MPSAVSTPWNRRSFVKAGLTLPALSMNRRFQAWATTPVMEKSQPKFTPFPLKDVRLTKSLIRTAADTNQNYLETLSTNRLLHSFRRTAGIASNAQPYGGWELPSCELRGHFAGGHYLSAAAFAYSSFGNNDLGARGDTMVAGLRACQKANGSRYVGAFPSSFFERLARGEKVWAPFYTLHKILAGLLDMYVQTGNEDALQVAEGIAVWTNEYFSKIGNDGRQLVLKEEFGGMNESLVNLAQLTRKERYLDTARFFEQPNLLDPLAYKKDNLRGLHANTTVPKIIGAARTYEVTGDNRYREIAEFFLDDVLRTRTYVIGNTSDDEHWRYPAGDMRGTLSLKNAECCVAYNLMKLDRLIFGWTGDSRWIDEYERTLFNARLGTQNDQGLKQYFFPLAAGYWRAFNSPEDSFWCCTGTGAEDFAKFNDTIYFHSDNDLYINLLIASELNWREKGFRLKQSTLFPAEQQTSISVQTDHPQERTIFMRIPRWTDERATVKVNGRAVEENLRPGSYLAIRRTWQSGDRVEVRVPMHLSDETLPGDASSVATLYGPLVLATILEEGPKDGPMKFIHGRPTEPKVTVGPAPLPEYSPISVRSAPDLRFSCAGTPSTVMAMYQVKDQRYSVYRSNAHT
jgi:uncharacterized protein